MIWPFVETVVFMDSKISSYQSHVNSRAFLALALPRPFVNVWPRLATFGSPTPRKAERGVFEHPIVARPICRRDDDDPTCLVSSPPIPAVSVRERTRRV